MSFALVVGTNKPLCNLTVTVLCVSVIDLWQCMWAVVQTILLHDASRGIAYRTGVFFFLRFSVRVTRDGRGVTRTCLKNACSAGYSSHRRAEKVRSDAIFTTWEKTTGLNILPNKFNDTPAISKRWGGWNGTWPQLFKGRTTLSSGKVATEKIKRVIYPLDKIIRFLTGAWPLCVALHTYTSVPPRDFVKRYMYMKTNQRI